MEKKQFEPFPAKCLQQTNQKTESELTSFQTFSECESISGDRNWLKEKDSNLCGNNL